MAKIKAGVSDPEKTFNLNDLDYLKSAFEVYYGNKTLVNDVLDTNNVTVGIRRVTDITDILQTPLRVSDWTDATDTPYSDFDTLIEDLYGFVGFDSPQAGGSSSFMGWIDYNDTTGNVALTANVWTDIPNNGLGAFSNRSTLPLAGGVTELLDVTDGSLDFSELEIDDIVLFRYDFTITPNTNNSVLDFRLLVGEVGSEYTLNILVPRLDKGSGIPYQQTGVFEVYMGDLNTRDGGAKLQVRLDSNGTLNNNGIYMRFLKH